MTLPYTLFWDYDDNKFNHIISVLRQREKEGKEAAAVAEAKADTEEALQSE